MNDKIIELFNKGWRVEWIAKQYYFYANSDSEQNHYENGNYIVTKKKITKQQAYDYCADVICDYLLQVKRGERKYGN